MLARRRRCRRRRCREAAYDYSAIADEPRRQSAADFDGARGGARQTIADVHRWLMLSLPQRCCALKTSFAYSMRQAMRVIAE
jgi:hypothetical protein